MCSLLCSVFLIPLMDYHSVHEFKGQLLYLGGMTLVYCSHPTVLKRFHFTALPLDEARG